MPGLKCATVSEMVRQYPAHRCAELGSYLEELGCERAHVLQQLVMRRKDALLHSRKKALYEKMKKLVHAHSTWGSVASLYSVHNWRLALADVLTPASTAGQDIITASGEVTTFGIREVFVACALRGV